MVEQRNAVAFEQARAAHWSCRAAPARSRRGTGAGSAAPVRPPSTACSAHTACTIVSGVPPDFDTTTKRVRERSNDDQRTLERQAIQIVVEARARARALRGVGAARNVPAGELRQGLAAEARSAGAEEDDGLRALAQARQRGFAGDDIVGCLRHAQQRQLAGAIVGLQLVERPAASLSSQASSSACGRPAAPMAFRGSPRCCCAQASASASAGPVCPRLPRPVSRARQHPPGGDRARVSRAIRAARGPWVCRPP